MPALKLAILRSAGVAALAVLAVCSGMPPSGAAPGDGGEVADAPTLGLESLGSDADIALYRLQGVQTLTVPMPAGLTLAR